MQHKSFDVVIVGSGLGGLVSAVLLAKEGYHVCVLEKNNQFGGNLQTFSRKKKIFDTGVHYIGGLEKGQNLYKYFEYLGIIDHLKLRRMPTVVDRVYIHEDEMIYSLSQGKEDFIENLSLVFPEEEVTIQKYITDISEICQSYDLYHLSGTVLSGEKLGANISVANYLKELTPNVRLQSALLGNNFLYAGSAKETPLYVHALIVNSYIDSAFQCVNGGSQISKHLIKQLRSLGGEAYKHREVVKYNVTDDFISSVETSEGQVFSGNIFISNTEPEVTLKQIGEAYFRKVYYQRIENIPTTISTFSLHIILKNKTVPYEGANMYYHMSHESIRDITTYLPEEWPSNLMISMTEDKVNQGYADTISILSPLRFDEYKEWDSTTNTVSKPQDRGEEYEIFNNEKVQKILSKLRTLFPYLETSIASYYVSTPLSYRDYIGGKNGSIYGPKKDINNLLNSRISPKTKIPNLYFVGQSVGMHGVLGVTIGAVNTIGEIVGHDYLIQKIRENGK